VGLRDVADQTLAIIEQRGYQAPAGHHVDLGRHIDRATTDTCRYRPAELARLHSQPLAVRIDAALHVEVTPETTAQAARRLHQQEGLRLAALNFASATNPGGNFLGGATAQEEDLARKSALYPCLLTQRAYYDENRAQPSRLYTDNLIYSPDVPFFRDEDLALVDEPFFCSILTSPAPFARAALRLDPGAQPAIHETLVRRAGHVLRVAAEHRHETLVLGAWGCGAFGNDPEVVAGVFADLLNAPSMRGAFARVTFAVYDRSPDQRTLQAFQDHWQG
jgi:uncharacterized protein (TIGR02452 family)